MPLNQDVKYHWICQKLWDTDILKSSLYVPFFIFNLYTLVTKTLSNASWQASFILPLFLQASFILCLLFYTTELYFHNFNNYIWPYKHLNHCHSPDLIPPFISTMFITTQEGSLGAKYYSFRGQSDHLEHGWEPLILFKTLYIMWLLLFIYVFM